ncbi:hypothetical protein C8Q74DRAFT_894461 [Fomes fomentarius]|nr:hypothetical protein C8Q74DRAFT_894461 [Fomes fomentarius]
MGDQTDPISRLLRTLLGNPLRDQGGNIGSTYTVHRTFGTSPKELDVPQPYDNKERAEAWKFCAEVVEDHSEALLKQWNAELDMQLVFAGLFSTALTAFNVESYSLLQPDKGDIAIAALALISAQLNDLSVGQMSANSTIISFVPPSGSAFMAPRYAIWLNALWFSSLVCTLSASSIAVMVKQWLHQYTKGVSGVSREAARLRQHRYESLHQWRVPQILMVLPILLQVSLFLFLAGVVILLWNIHPIVATCASSLFGLLLLFTVITTILPAFRVDCCYLSPQAMGIFTYSQLLGRFLVSSLSVVAARLSAVCETGSRDVSRMKRCGRRMLRLLTQAIRQLGRWSSWPSWDIRERMAVESRVQYLDRSLAATTYAVTLDDDVLNAELSRCMWDMDADNLTPFCRDVLSAPGIDHDRRGTPLDTFLLNYCISAMSKANEYQLGSSADRETLMDYPIWFSTQSLEERCPSDMLDGLPDHHSAYLWGLARMAPQHTSAFFRLAEILEVMPKSSGMDARTIRKETSIRPLTSLACWRSSSPVVPLLIRGNWTLSTF